MKKNIAKNIFIYLLSLICILPFIIMIVYSFKGADGGFTLKQYGKALFQTEDFFTGFWNSVIYTCIIIGVNIPISLLGAYGFSQSDYKGKRSLFLLYIILMMMPFQATIVPQYLTLKALKIIDTPAAVVIPNIFSTFGTFLIAQYMRGLDKEIIDAGRIDGLSEFKLLIKIAAPMCRPIIFALTVLLFINYWSMVEQPLVFISDTQDMPLAVTLNVTGGFRQIAFALGTVFSFLPILLYQFSYGDLMHGISLTSGTNKSVNSSVTSSEEEGPIQKERIRKTIIIFMIAMGVLTLATQKITYVMTPTVEVVQTKSADIKENPKDTTSKSLGYFNTVIPDTCIHREGSDNFIYIVSQEKSKRGRKQIIKVTVSVEAANGVEAAVFGAIPQNANIIKWSTKPVKEGMIIKIAGERG